MRRLAFLAFSSLASLACVGDSPVAGVDAGSDTGTVSDAGGGDAAQSGILDSTFKNGRKDTAMSARALAVDAKSRVYVAGTLDKCVGASSSNDFAVMRFTAAGDLDTSYGNVGTACAELGSGNFDTGLVLAIDSNGRAVVGGRSSANNVTPKNGLGLVRLAEDGKPDTTFNGTGVLRMAQTADLVVLGIAFDGGFLYAVGANSYDDSLATAGFLLKVDEATGVPVGGFGTGGILDQPSMRGCNAIVAAAGYLFVAGSSNASPRQFALKKLDAKGAAAPGFGNAGLVTAAPSSSGDSEGQAVAVQPDGTVYVAGSTGAPLGQVGIASVMRFSPTGVADAAFSPFVSGALRWEAAGGRVGVYPASDGSAVLPGLVPTGQRSPALTRVTSKGTLDASFGVGGVALPPYISDNTLRGTARDPQTGRLVVLGDDAGHVFLSRFAL